MAEPVRFEPFDRKRHDRSGAARLRVALAGAASIASVVMEADAKDDAAWSFYAKAGFRSLIDDRLHMFLPMEPLREAISKT